MKPFKSILEFQEHFNTNEKCREFLEEQRWHGKPCCVFCGSDNVTRLKIRRIFQCNEKLCHKQFSVTVGTYYEHSRIPLTKWFLATYILSVHSKGISSLQLANWLNITQRSAWFLNHRIREQLTDKTPELLTGIVEVDETYVGGLEGNKHRSKRIRNGVANKAMVLGAVQRDGKVRTKVITETTTENVTKAITEFIEPDSTMLTDEHRAYNQLNKVYKHETVKHREEEYVRGYVHTNTIEGYWNILKKQIIGIHHFVSPKHLQRYCNESGFRYNNRAYAQDERFAGAIANCEGRLKYNQLTAKKESV